MKKRCTGDGNGGGGCGALLLVEEADIFHTESYARDEMTRYATFMCSECGVLTDFDDGEVPSHVWDRAPSQKAWKERHGV
jgi:hypothetical protein